MEDFDADRTIQLDQIDRDDLELPPERNVTPPPLPPEPKKPPVAATKNGSSAKTIGLVVAFLVLLAGVIVLGLKMGDLAHPTPPPTTTSAAAPKPSVTATAAPSASAAPVQTIDIKPIEMR